MKGRTQRSAKLTADRSCCRGGRACFKKTKAAVELLWVAMFSRLQAAVCNGLWGNNSCGGYAISGSDDPLDRMAGGGGGGSYSSVGDRSLTSGRGGSRRGTFGSDAFGGGSVFNGGDPGIPWGAGIGN